MWVDAFIEPFQYQFLIRALIVCVSVGVMCPLLGAHVINREMGFMGDALAHAVLPGMVAAYAVGLSPLVGAIPAGIVVSLAIGFMVRKSNISSDTSIGILFTGLFALGLVMITLMGGISVNVEDILLGQVMSTSNSEVYITICLTVITLCLMTMLYLSLIHI